MTVKAKKKSLEDILIPAEATSENHILLSPNPPNWKDIKITMMDNLPPKVEFSGKWSGKDIAIVLGSIKRAYPLYNKTLRRGSLFIKE